MKKCIASFLICFVFAFGLISAFGCRDVVLASSNKLIALTGGQVMSFTFDGVNFSGEASYTFDIEGDDFIYQCAVVYRNPDSSNDRYRLFLLSEKTFSGSYHVLFYNRDDDRFTYDQTFSLTVQSVDGLYFSYIDGINMCNSPTSYPFPYALEYLSPSESLPDSGDTALDLWNDVIKLEHGFSAEFEFSDDIGYLTGFSHDLTQYIESESSNSDKGQVWDTYSWNLTTSSGYTIQSDDTVRLRLVCSYGDFARDIVDYDVSGDKSVYMVDRSDLLEQCDSIAAYKDSLSFWEILTSGFGKSDPLSVVCYACVFTSDGRCGSWIRQDSTWNMDNGGNGYDPNVSVGNFDDDGNFVSDSDKGYVGGQGNSTYDPDTGILYSGVDNLDSSSLIGAIKNLVDGVGQVPQIIALMFLWLPSWVLTFFSVCVAIWGLVLVKKAIFG